MASFGENLRREREMRGVTLDEISAATKISVRFLKAIEAEDLPILPGGIFTRSFIRAYARYLGLDEDRILAEYLLVAQPRAELTPSRITVSKQLPQRGSLRAVFLVLVIASAIMGGSYLLYRHSRRAAEMQGNAIRSDRVAAASSATATQPREKGAPAPEPSVVQRVATKSPSTGPAPPTQSPAAEPPSQASQPKPAPTVTKGAEAGSDLVLQVAATERAWVAVDADGKTSFQRILNPNEVKTVKANESFDVITGNAQGIILTLNGETLKPLGGHNMYKKIHLTRDDLKNPAP